MWGQLNFWQLQYQLINYMGMCCGRYRISTPGPCLYHLTPYLLLCRVSQWFNRKLTMYFCSTLVSLFVASFACLTASRCCWFSWWGHIICLVSYGFSVICFSLNSSEARSMETMFGIPCFSIVTECVSTVGVLYVPYARHSNLLHRSLALSSPPSGALADSWDGLWIRTSLPWVLVPDVLSCLN